MQRDLRRCTFPWPDVEVRIRGLITDIRAEAATPSGDTRAFLGSLERRLIVIAAMVGGAR